MPDMYPEGEYDLAGFCVGVAERSALIDGSAIREGDVLLGLPSSGPHSNGYSLIRRVLEIARDRDIDGVDAAHRLLEPTRIYVRPILELMLTVNVRGMAHITGGGLTENVPRVLPDGLHAEIDVNSWRQGAVFDWLAEQGGIAADEMRRTFNCGVGLVVVVAPDEAAAARSALAAAGVDAWTLGRIAAGGGEVPARARWTWTSSWSCPTARRPARWPARSARESRRAAYRAAVSRTGTLTTRSSRANSTATRRISCCSPASCASSARPS